MKRINAGIVIVLCLSLVGCAAINEGVRGFFGVSTKALEERRDEAVSRVCSLEPAACREKVRTVLSDIGAHIYAENQEKGLIAVYVSRSDTTPVGIFISENNGKSRIEVSSRSTYAKELIAEKLFEALE